MENFCFRERKRTPLRDVGCYPLLYNSLGIAENVENQWFWLLKEVMESTRFAIDFVSTWVVLYDSLELLMEAITSDFVIAIVGVKKLSLTVAKNYHYGQL